jgi:hypothetical protein
VDAVTDLQVVSAMFLYLVVDFGLRVTSLLPPPESAKRLLKHYFPIGFTSVSEPEMISQPARSLLR